MHDADLPLICLYQSMLQHQQCAKPTCQWFLQANVSFDPNRTQQLHFQSGKSATSFSRPPFA